MEGLGPITASRLSVPLAIGTAEVKATLIKLEQEGFVVRGQLTQSKSIHNKQHTEWCERRLLARIHRYTLNRLRNEIEPVSIATYMRFLFAWHGLNEKVQGIESLAAVLQQLEGYSIPAQCWQSDILPARVQLFSTSMLESLTLSGRISWLRLNVTAHQDKIKSVPVRLTPIALIQRSNQQVWQTLSPGPTEAEQNLSGLAEKIVTLLQKQGALFFTDIVQQTGVLKAQVEDALGELVNWGLVTSDNYAGLQALTTPASKRPRMGARRGRQSAVSGFDNAGRWSLLQANDCKRTINDEDLEFIAMVLLDRYGVVFKKVLQRESKLPPWRDLLKVYWRLEARGEIRGGRFVESVSGEQFALPSAIGTLKKIRNSQKTGEFITLSSADPLNLVGILLPGEKIAVSVHNQIVFLNGVAIAIQHKNEVQYLSELDETVKQQVKLEL